MSTTAKKDYIKLVSDEIKCDYNAAKRMMDRAKSRLGVTYSEYYKNRMFDLSTTQQTVEARRIIVRRNNKNKRLDKIANATGLTRAEVRKKIRETNKISPVKLTLIMYAKYEVYRFEGEALKDCLDLLAKRDCLRDSILEDFIKIDAGEMTYSSIDDKMAEFYAVIEKIMPDSLFEELTDMLLICYPAWSSEPDKCRNAAIDMEATRVLLPFSLSEYVSFHFAERTIEEKRTFISDKERLEVLNVINDPDEFDAMDNKSIAYKLLGSYYGRDAITVTTPDDYQEFKKFCKGRRKFVAKPPCDTMGRGIRVIDVPWFFGRKKLFISLLEEFGEVLLEELIIAHESIYALNPDSVNTVRIVTYYDGEKSIVHDSFMKVGQKGSFVDNGGAGGIFVHVDPKTGMLDTNGCDENGVIYETHPYTKTRFDGYQLPEWDKALALGLELADKVPGLNYLGWDFTYTKDGKWIVVEGNAKTQFFGQQCTTGIGVREDFLNTVGYIKQT